MNKEAKRILKKWAKQSKIGYVKQAHVADVGSFYVNGSVKEFFEDEGIDCKVTGFDIVDGKNVDVVIDSGVIPEEHRNKFKFITCVGTFDYGSNYDIINEIIDLSKSEADIYLTLAKNKKDGNKRTVFHYKKNKEVMTHFEFKKFIKKTDVLKIELYIRDKDKNGAYHYFLKKNNNL